MFAIEDSEYLAYVIKNTHKYIPRFRRFDDLAGNFIVTWHWPAFFVGPWWFLYRKMYLASLIMFVLTLVPYVNFFATLASGMSAYFFYYRHTRTTIERLKEQFSGDDLHARLMELGGVHGWVPLVAVVLNVGILILISVAALLGMLAGFFDDPNAMSFL